MKTFNSVVRIASFTAATLFTANAAQASFFDIGVDITGGVHDVGIEYCDDFLGAPGGYIDLATSCGEGFSLSFSGVPGPFGTSPLALFVDPFNVPDTNLLTYSFAFKGSDFFDGPFEISSSDIGDLLTLLWLVDGNGGSLQAFDLLPLPTEDYPFVVFDEVEFFGFGPDDPVSELFARQDALCSFAGADAGDCVEFDDDVFYSEFISFPELALANTQPPGGAVPAPAPLVLLATGLLLLRRKART